MKERVTIKTRLSNLLIVCPHGHKLDDEHTNILSDKIAEKLNCHAVINNGWKRSDVVDALIGNANCNNYKHCSEPVVLEEFLTPIGEAISFMLDDDDDADAVEPLVICVHGIGNSVRKKHGVPDLDIVVGYGNGDPMRGTCTTWRKNSVVDSLISAGGFKVYEGSKGGPYSAHSYNNLVQGIRRDYGVNVLQFEFIHAIRSTEKIIEDTANRVAKSILAAMTLSSYTRPHGTVCEI